MNDVTPREDGSQSIAAKGWIVLQPNYRGSTNLGLRYQRAVAGATVLYPSDARVLLLVLLLAVVALVDVVIYGRRRW